MVAASDVLLNAKVVAGLTGRSIYTLQRARHDRPDLHMPPHVRTGTRGVGYRLDQLLAWARYRDVWLHWQDLPLRFVLPAMQAHQRAGLPVPPGLRLRVALSPGHGSRPAGALAATTPAAER